MTSNRLIGDALDGVIDEILAVANIARETRH
jgi:hypothetical protein